MVVLYYNHTSIGKILRLRHPDLARQILFVLAMA